MQNYWDRRDWLTRAYPFKCVGTYESQILVDFTDNPPDAPASRHARLYLSLVNCAAAGQEPQGAVDEISWKSNEELVTLLYWDTWESWCVPPSTSTSSPPVSSYCLSVRERPPRCLISYIIRETAGRGCRQLTRGCKGRISCDFLEGWGHVRGVQGCGIYSDLMPSVSGSHMISHRVVSKRTRTQPVCPSSPQL